MGKYQRAKGTHDLYPGAPAWEDDSVRWNVVENAFRELCFLFGYSEVRTPVFESTDLFKRTIGEETDIVSKEMYTFQDQGGRSLTLRPEGTAPTLRAYVDSPLSTQSGVAKMYYITSVFRYERQQRGRYRQHQQLGVEAIGSEDPALDAEVIQMAMMFFRKIGIKNLTLKINSVGSIASRAGYLSALKAYVEPFLGEFSAEGQGRFAANPLRLLDTKNVRELEILSDAPRLKDFLADDESAHFNSLTGILTSLGITYTVDPYLVRGFDYYTKTAFEIQSPDLGAQNALGGGGRYDKLVGEIGGNPAPGIGFGLGVERALIALQAIGAEQAIPDGPRVFVVTQGDAARAPAFQLLSRLREHNIASDMDYSSRNMKAQMRTADRTRAEFAAIIGDDEAEQHTVQLKNLASREQVTLPIDNVVSYLTEAGSHA